MARNPLWDTEKLSSHTPRVGAREPCVAAATRGVESSRAAAAADGDGPDLLGVVIEVADELAALASAGAAGYGGRLAPARIPAVLGVEKSFPTRSAQDWQRGPRPNSTDELRQSALGCTKDPRRVAEARFDSVASHGVEVHAPASAATVAGVAHVSEEPHS